MESFWCFIKYNHWILHKKLVEDEYFTIFHKSTHIFLNIGHTISNPHTLEYPFSLAGHITIH